jgi:hypothetical protein
VQLSSDEKSWSSWKPIHIGIGSKHANFVEVTLASIDATTNSHADKVVRDRISVFESR